MPTVSRSPTRVIDTAFFLLSKAGWLLIKPGSWILIGFAWGLWCLFRGRIPRARRILSVTFAATLSIAVLPVDEWAARPLETRFPPIDPPASVDGIIILGGFEDFTAMDRLGRIGLNSAAERLVEGLALARMYPDAVVVFSGGSGDPLRQQDVGAELALAYAVSLGFSADRFTLEGTSRNTYENAANTQEMIEPDPDANWLLVTSALHMPRSMGIFCALGMPVTAYPVDFTTGEPTLRPAWNLSGHLELLTRALREWVGLAVYRATGRSSAFVPTHCETS